MNETRTVDLGAVSEFRVCFEVDTSINTNNYFQDRPSFTYKTEISGYETFKYMAGEENLPFIMDPDGNYDSLVSTLSVRME